MIQENITLDRRLLELKIGTVVWWKGNEYQISDILSFSEVVATHLETYKSSIIPINELGLDKVENNITKLSCDDIVISEKDWSTALKRYSIIQPFIDESSKTEIIKLAEEEGYHYTTIYNWLSAYRKTRSILSLVPNKRGWKESKTRLKDTTELIIKQVLKDYYLTEQKPRLSFINSNFKSILE